MRIMIKGGVWKNTEVSWRSLLRSAIHQVLLEIHVSARQSLAFIAE